MDTIGVRELKRNTSKILRRVRQKGEQIQVTYRGQVIALLVPARPAKLTKKDLAVWAELDQLAAQIARRWPAGVTAANAVSEARR